MRRRRTVHASADKTSCQQTPNLPTCCSVRTEVGGEDRGRAPQRNPDPAGDRGLQPGPPGAVHGPDGDDVVFHIPGISPVAGTYRGKAEVGGFFGHMAQLSEGSQQVELLHVLTGGDHLVVSVCKAKGARKGQQYEGIAGYIFRFADGKIVEATNLQQDQDQIDRFWSA
jgi:uncharacterized protein